MLDRSTAQTASAGVDHVLTTTRAVRQRLDLDRPVDLQIIYDCIDIAEQAPTGGNQGSRRWIVVRDPEIRAQLGELYRDVMGGLVLGARDRLAGTGDPREKVLRSSAHLVEHLAEVPVIVIPTIIGRHDGSGRPGLFDSVIQSAWSFCLALRARGLGTCWVTGVLAKHDELKELLQIPESMTEIVMLPVAWTKGTDFGRARRYDARAITYIDSFARTFEAGPSDPIRFNDGPGTVAEVDIRATPAEVWASVSDINAPARFSDELVSAAWEIPTTSAELGATFIGHNEARGHEWDTRCFVDAYAENRVFGWRTSNPKHPGARWRFELEPIAGSTRLRFSASLGPGPSGTSKAIERHPADEPQIIERRLAQIHFNLVNVVEGIKATAETTDGSV
jgi:nitroreductase